METETVEKQTAEGKLRVAEHFFTIQGEGKTMGTPSVFLRLAGCVLRCQWCDTHDTWQQGRWFDIDELDALFRDNSYYKKIKKGAHLVVTGGDPIIQQKSLVSLFKRMCEFDQDVGRMFVEIETEGVLQPSEDLSGFVRQWNVSPKLANSGMSEEKRLKEDVLRWHSFNNSYFKFPIVGRQDLNEVDEIVRRARIRRGRVYLMPVCSTREEHDAASGMIVELAKMSGYCYSPRLQLILWNKTVGV